METSWNEDFCVFSSWLLVLQPVCLCMNSWKYLSAFQMFNILQIPKLGFLFQDCDWIRSGKVRLLGQYTSILLCSSLNHIRSERQRICTSGTSFGPCFKYFYFLKKYFLPFKSPHSTPSWNNNSLINGWLEISISIIFQNFFIAGTSELL